MKYGTLFKANTVIVCASSGQSTIMHVQHSRLNLLSRCIITYLAWFFPVYILMANNGSAPGKLLSMHLTLSRWSDPWNLLFFAGLCSKQTNTLLFPAPSLLFPDMIHDLNVSTHLKRSIGWFMRWSKVPAVWIWHLRGSRAQTRNLD